VRFLLDQDVYAVTVRYLCSKGHDVVTATDPAHATATDLSLLELASSESRILISRDRDYGELVFVRGARTGVIYLRILPSTLEAVHAEFDRVLSSYSEADLRRAFVVVEPARHRIRRFVSK
jgi:predicted nuclease of predicted toxin-antitoxin system